ncbi:hypothetical protein Aasi_1943 [Candidatus Amoebophilus asiaticus 5a2]|uniref:Uncharacterized protein n=1 Tax=Amoebophilus asiaticus (strain 5a2) TaxID=452471 RepID=C3L4A5_AMOA5|nr:hypothetical protein Aasi_1943 [Candidatus Amoebophilus asiaticus 5a2]
MVQENCLKFPASLNMQIRAIEQALNIIIGDESKFNKNYQIAASVRIIGLVFW